MSKEPTQITEADDSNEPTLIQHKRGLGRPAPGELQAGEIGINISSIKTDKDKHGLWDSYIIEPARAFTADEEGVIHAIGDWESLAPSPIYGDVAYQTSYVDAADARVRPGWQQALMSYKNYVAFENEFDKKLFPLDANDEIDVDKYLHNFAAIKFDHKHGKYVGEELETINPPVARIYAQGLWEDYEQESNVTFEMHCLDLTIFTGYDSGWHNKAFFLQQHKLGKDLSKDDSGTYPTAQLFLNAPEHVLKGNLESHWQINDDFMEKPDSALVVYGGASVVGGAIKATASQVPAAPEEGMIYFNTVEKKFFGFDGTSWIDLAGGGGDAAPAGDIDGGSFTTAQEWAEEQEDQP
jgi:hypothetical protein